MDKLEKQAEQLFEEGTTLYEQEKPQAAEEKFIAALEIAPQSEEIRYNLALAQYEQGKYEASYQNAVRIFNIDCTELLQALEEAGYEPKIEIPEQIPNHCALCGNFEAGSTVKDAGGFCHFYRTFVHSDARCLVWQLVEEGTIDKSEIEDRIQAANEALRQKLAAILKDDWLPDFITCPNCGQGLELSASQRQLGRFQCTRCKQETDVAEASRKLRSEYKNKSERELLEIVLAANDFLPEYVAAARVELVNRQFDILDFPDLLVALRNIPETN